MNDDPSLQAVADANREAEAAINDNSIPITVRTSNNNESTPEGDFKPLADAGADFIEAPVDDAVEEKPAGKSINIVDQTPEAEDLINGAPAEAAEPVEPITPIENENETKEEEKVEIKPIEPVEPIAPVMPSHANNADINIDAEHAYEESNEDFFRSTREKISNLRKERNECIVSADKKEDELTNVERYNSQYEIAGAFDKIDRERVESLRNEIRDIRAQADTKDKAIRAALKIIRTM